MMFRPLSSCTHKQSILSEIYEVYYVGGVPGKQSKSWWGVRVY